LKTGLAQNSIQLVDVRTEEEREEFNIGGEHIPLIVLLAYAESIAKNEKTVFYCSSGKRSAEAVRIIKSRFHNANVFSLEGGLSEWPEVRD
jgi:rhodanese-related sulfurtransferase